MTLTKRTGKENGVIAIETAGTCGSLFLNGAYYDLLTDKVFSGNIELAPYEVLMLNQV